MIQKTYLIIAENGDIMGVIRGNDASFQPPPDILTLNITDHPDKERIIAERDKYKLTKQPDNNYIFELKTNP